MYRKDYILFIIEQFARLLKKIIARILNRDYDDAAAMIEQIYRERLGLNSDLINRFSYKYLMKMQSIDPEFYAARCLILARLLQAESRIFYEQENYRESLERGVKSLQVLSALFDEGQEFDVQEFDIDVRELQETVSEGAKKLGLESDAVQTLIDATKKLLAPEQPRNDE